MHEALFLTGMSICCGMQAEHDSAFKTIFQDKINIFDNENFEEFSQKKSNDIKNIRISEKLMNPELDLKIKAKNVIIENNIVVKTIDIKCENLFIKNTQDRFYAFHHNEKPHLIEESQVSWVVNDKDPFGEEKIEELFEKIIDPLLDRLEKQDFKIDPKNMEKIRIDFLKDLRNHLFEKIKDQNFNSAIDHFVEKISEKIKGIIREIFIEHKTKEERIKYFKWDIKEILKEMSLSLLDASKAIQSYKTRLDFLSQQKNHSGTMIAKDIQVIAEQNIVIHGAILLADQIMLLSDSLCVEGQNTEHQNQVSIETPYSFIASDANVFGVGFPGKYLNLGGFVYGPQKLRYPQNVENALETDTHHK
jgi:hypothetical protein